MLPTSIYLVVLPTVLCLVIDPISDYPFPDEGFGSVDPSSEGFAVFGNTTEGSLGISVHNLGDINGDGVDDMIIGEPYYNENRGRAVVVFGQTSDYPSMTADSAGSSYGFTLHCDSQAKSYLGFSVSGGGDYNGDGINDILVGGYHATATWKGKVAVIWGRNSSNPWTDIDVLDSIDPSVGVVFTGSYNYEAFGYVVEHIGDFNGDSYDDFMIGASGFKSPSTSSFSKGAYYIVFGRNSSTFWTSEDISAENSLRIIGSGDGGFFGRQGSSAGDFNNDSIADILISEPHLTLVENGEGRAHVLFGNRSHTVGSIDIANFTDGDGLMLSGSSTADKIGLAVGGGCDVNGDGFSDIVVGSQRTLTRTEIGVVVYGKATGNDIEFDIDDFDGIIFNCEQTSGHVMRAGCLGDLDGDGFDEVYFYTSYDTFRVIFGQASDPLGGTVLSTELRSVQVTNMIDAANVGNFWNPENITVALSNEDVDTGVTEGGAVYVLKNFPIPVLTESPTFMPSVSPTVSPTGSPSTSPTVAPSESPTSSPTSHPSVAPTDSPTTSPSASPTVALESCDIILTTTGGAGVSWDLTDSEGDEEIASAEFGAAATEFTLLASEEYLLFISTTTIPDGSTITVSIDGVETTIPLDGVSTASEIAGVTCAAIVSKVGSIDSATTAAATGILGFLMLLF